MTTLMMPSDYGADMFLGSSPVLTSGYLTTQNFIHDYSRLQPSPLQGSPLQANYSSLWGNSCNASSNPNQSSFSSTIVNSNNYFNMFESQARQSQSCASSYSNGLASRGSLRRFNSLRERRSKKGPASIPRPTSLQPMKSCLSAKQPEDFEDGATSPTRLKKKVVFADSQGHPLTEIRILTERSDCPPKWTADFLDQVTGGAQPEALGDTWELAFKQPVSDYLNFKHKLENEFVALENVVIKEAESRIAGTVKVRNLSYHKKVSVRYTVDHWQTSDEVDATYVPSTVTCGAYDIYDTFSFMLPLPSSTQADKLEFCICFDCDGTEYWDNNSNKNYVLVSFRPMTQNIDDPHKPADVHQVDLDSWSEFASWNHLSISESPYW